MIDVGWAVPLIAGAIFVALNVVAVWGGYRYFLKCREVDRLRQEIDEWQGSRGWAVPMTPFDYRSGEWDTMCDAMRDAATGSTSDDDE